MHSTRAVERRLDFPPIRHVLREDGPEASVVGRLDQMSELVEKLFGQISATRGPARQNESSVFDAANGGAQFVRILTSGLEVIQHHAHVS